METVTNRRTIDGPTRILIKILTQACPGSVAWPVQASGENKDLNLVSVTNAAKFDYSTCPTLNLLELNCIT